MIDAVEVQCPYCLERVELTLDPMQRGEMIEDCEVCCRPWRILVRRRRDGQPIVVVERAQ
ncbi:MAG: CPXCG motif-containing cysteine-rich protein [Nannocystaceae bacterium]